MSNPAGSGDAPDPVHCQALLVEQPRDPGGELRQVRCREVGVEQSALFATATTGTSTGAVNSFHDSYTSIGGGMLLLNMMLGEVTPGGVGSGLYGILVIATLSVFIAGLMVGRTPEYLQKKIGTREIRQRSATPPSGCACSWTASCRSCLSWPSPAPWPGRCRCSRPRGPCRRTRRCSWRCS